MYEFRQETALQLKECRDLRFPRDKRRGCLATSPGSKLPMVRSVLLRTFLNQKVLETFGQHDPIPSSVWKETAGVGPCMENKSHGVAGGGRCGWKTLKRQFVVVSNCTYFFENMKGQGKVQSFATAGAEHCQRERVWQKKKEFEASADYREAVAASLDSLSKDVGEDSSSQHSREFQRLFLAWLSQEDRDFLTASEGLGNSQKAEVAWLERKGYQYTEVDIIQFNRSFMGVPSPIGEQSQDFTQQRAKRKHVGAAWCRGHLHSQVTERSHIPPMGSSENHEWTQSCLSMGNMIPGGFTTSYVIVM